MLNFSLPYHFLNIIYYTYTPLLCCWVFLNSFWFDPSRSLVSWFSHLCVEIVNPLSLHLVYILKILYTYLNSFFYSYLDVAVSIYSLTWEPCLCLFILYACHHWNVIIWTTMSNIMRIFFERISSIIFTHLFILWNYFSLFFFQHFLFFRSLFDLLMYILNLCQCSLW